MKKWGLLMLVLALAGCGARKAESVEGEESEVETENVDCVESEDIGNKVAEKNWGDVQLCDSLSGVFLDAESSGDTIGYVLGRFVRPDVVDVLYCVALGTRNYDETYEPDELVPDNTNLIDTYVLTNDKAGIAPLYLTSTYYLNNLKTSDLDGDGRDELGFVDMWWMSCWQTYAVFCLSGGEWMSFCRPITYYVCNDRDPAMSAVVKPSGKKGYILAYEDGWDDPNNPMNLELKEELVKIERTTIKHEYDTCFSLPGGKPIVLPVAVDRTQEIEDE